MNKNKYTENQIKYIIDNYHNFQTWKLSEDLDIPIEEVRDIAEKYHLKKDDDFIVIRKQNKLTLEQCNFILENYATMKNSEIIKILNITYKELKSFANRRKLKKKNRDFSDLYYFNEYERNFILENYSNMETSEIAKLLKKDKLKIVNFANSNGIVKNKNVNKYHKSKLTKEQKIFIINNFANMNTKEICSKLNLTYEDVTRYAKSKNISKECDYLIRQNGMLEKIISKRNNPNYDVFNYIGRLKEPKVDDLYKSKYGKYYINQDYFNIIDNEWKAYWLGFLYADGCNRITSRKNKNEYVLKLSLKSTDSNHIEKFRDSLQTNSPLKFREIKSGHQNKTYEECCINICNKNICEKLNDLGCIPNKSLTLKFPNEDQVPNHLIRHFVRGYFDGDGCICINIKDDNRTTSFSLLGTYEFLETITNLFYNELHINKKKICRKKNNKAYSISYGKHSDVEKIYKYLYKDCNIYLDRKLNKFDTLFCLD